MYVFEGQQRDDNHVLGSASCDTCPHGSGVPCIALGALNQKKVRMSVQGTRLDTHSLTKTRTWPEEHFIWLSYIPATFRLSVSVEDYGSGFDLSDIAKRGDSKNGAHCPGLMRFWDVKDLGLSALSETSCFK